jgi:hypothetical protein
VPTAGAHRQPPRCRRTTSRRSTDDWNAALRDSRPGHRELGIGVDQYVRRRRSGQYWQAYRLPENLTTRFDISNASEPARNQSCPRELRLGAPVSLVIIKTARELGAYHLINALQSTALKLTQISIISGHSQVPLCGR